MKKSISWTVTLLIITNNVPAQPPEELRGVKLTNVASNVMFSNSSIAEAMDYLASIGMNAVMPVVWNPGLTCYPSAVMNDLIGIPVNPKFAGRDPLECVVVEAHRNGIEVFPWFEYGFAASHEDYDGVSPYQNLMLTFPDWLSHDNQDNVLNKNGFYWFSGINPDVQQLMTDLAVEVTSIYDIDGIEYSDRMPALPFEGGYDIITREIYASEHDGVQPPDDPKNSSWMRWRADKLNAFYDSVRVRVKAIDPNVLISSSPSVYAWCYDEYLQDSQTWVLDGIVDNLIPQVYRYNLTDYKFELNKSLNYLPGYRDIIFSGMLMKVGDYLIDPQFLLESIKYNRQQSVNGEVFFFYEGLRADHNKLGDTLRATYYQQDAVQPHRNGNVWRPKGLIANEDDSTVILQGNWENRAVPGFKGGIIRTNNSQPASIEYYLDVPYAAWYHLYVFIKSDLINSSQVHYTYFSNGSAVPVEVNQKSKERWFKLGDVYLEQGKQKVVYLDNTGLITGEYIMSDAVMLLLNRKLSPGVVITSVKNKTTGAVFPETMILEQNYPNPFNNQTRIRFYVPLTTPLQVNVYDIQGRKIRQLFKGIQSPGWHHIDWTTSDLSSGMYFCQIRSMDKVYTGKMILMQ
jgi:uncharacterized lipoprotein YddW (UPF0748 family)